MACRGYFVIYLPRKTQFICTSGFQPSPAFHPVFQLVDWGRRRSDGFLEVSVVVVSVGIIPKLYPLLQPLGHTTPNQSICIVGCNRANCKCHFLWFIVLLVLKYCHFYEFGNITSVHNLFRSTLSRRSLLWWIFFLNSRCLSVSLGLG